MTRQQVHVRLVCSCIALCVPLACGSQPVVVAATPLVTQNLPVTFPDETREHATRLDGRLFFTALERQRMDVARKRGVVFRDDGKFAEVSPSVLNGFVKRNDGQITVWVDGQAQNHVRSLKIRDLQPQDVGGNSDLVKVLDSYPVAKQPTPPASQSAKKQASRNFAAKQAKSK